MAGPAENLGETLVPVVNRLQDIFSQVLSRCSTALHNLQLLSQPCTELQATKP